MQGVRTCMMEPRAGEGKRGEERMATTAVADAVQTITHPFNVRDDLTVLKQRRALNGPSFDRRPQRCHFTVTPWADQTWTCPAETVVFYQMIQGRR